MRGISVAKPPFTKYVNTFGPTVVVTAGSQTKCVIPNRKGTTNTSLLLWDKKAFSGSQFLLVAVERIEGIRL